MTSRWQPLITTEQTHYSSTDQTQDVQDSLTLTEVPHSGLQTDDQSQEDNTTRDEFTIVDKDDPMADIVKKTNRILRPYMIFLNIIGWRKIDLPSRIMSRPWLRRTCEMFQFLMILVLVFLLFVSCVTQILLCFDRVLVLPSVNDHLDGVYHIKCLKHIVSKFIIQDILLLFAFCYSLYIFRIKQPEDLSTLAQKVFVAVKDGLSKKLTMSLRTMLVMFILWIFFCVGINILQVFVTHMNNEEVDFEFIGNISLPGKITLLTISLFGLFVFDVAFAAVVINYAMQCQLMVYWFKGICTHILTKPGGWNIDEGIKEVNDAHSFLKKINGHLSNAVGIMMFMFFYSSVLSLYGIRELNGDHDDDVVLHAVAGFLTVVRWTLLFFIPLIQAARVTHFGSEIKETALMIRTRPFQHQDTAQLDLDSFVTYCSNIELKAKLISVPILPSLVVGGTFIFGLAFFILLRFDEFSWATWL